MEPRIYPDSCGRVACIKVYNLPVAHTARWKLASNKEEDWESIKISALFLFYLFNYSIKK
jgi:hypothetical protein